MRIIPYYGEMLGEVRDVRFLRALGKSEEKARIVAFGRCNYNCPYCRRDAQFVDSSGNIISSIEVPDDEIYSILQKALDNGERIRLSGGDPCMHPRDSLAIANWAYEQGHKISVCHNGSSPEYIKKMAPYIAYAAIDLKAIEPNEYALRAGINVAVAQRMIPYFKEVCWNVLHDRDALLDIRTCVFSDTSIDDLMIMAQHIALLGNYERIFWTIRQYNLVSSIDWFPLCQETLLEWLDMISEEFPWLHIGCRLEWRGGIFYQWYNGKRSEL